MDKPGRSRRYFVPEHADRTIVGLSVLRDQVIVPILAGLRTDPVDDLRPTIEHPIDTHYETLRCDMLALIRDLGITTESATAA